MNETCQNPQMCCYIAGAVGFVAGVILTCIVCKLRGGCKCGGQNDASRRPVFCAYAALFLRMYQFALSSDACPLPRIPPARRYRPAGFFAPQVKERSSDGHL